jgi:hypothetical protein
MTKQAKTRDVLRACGCCGKPLPLAPRRGRPARYCSHACRTKAWRAHAAAERSPT